MQPAAANIPRCLCGARFDTHQHLLDHATSKGHRFRCSCDASFKDAETLNFHHAATGHTNSIEAPAIVKFVTDPDSCIVPEDKCAICSKTFTAGGAAAATQHRADKHHVCPTCFQVFENACGRVGHQKHSGHCYCDQHGLVFTDRLSYLRHERSEPHVAAFECMDCDRYFGTQRALHHHLAGCSAGAPARITEQEASAVTAAALARVEEANLRCEACDKTFEILTAQRQHKQSVKHHPLSEIRCFLSGRCKQVFTSPSAYILHLESGKCESGMNRNTLNRLVHAADSGNKITYSDNTRCLAPVGGADAASLLSALSCLSVSSSSGVMLTPSQSDASSASTASTRAQGRILTSNEEDAASTSTATATIRDAADSDSVASMVTARMQNGQTSELASAANDVTPSTINESDGVLLTPDDSDAATVVSADGTILTPSITSTSTGGVILTPSESHTGEWSFIPSYAGGAEAITYDRVCKGLVCNVCDKVFKKELWLLQHLNSPTHETKLYHCKGVSAEVAPGERNKKPVKKLKTLSGFAQHLEAGSCTGGKDGLKIVAGLFEEELRKSTGQEVRLLHRSA